jgi:hypothetical protein
VLLDLQESIARLDLCKPACCGMSMLHDSGIAAGKDPKASNRPPASLSCGIRSADARLEPEDGHEGASGCIKDLRAKAAGIVAGLVELDAYLSGWRDGAWQSTTDAGEAGEGVESGVRDAQRQTRGVLKQSRGLLGDLMALSNTELKAQAGEKQEGAMAVLEALQLEKQLLMAHFDQRIEVQLAGLGERSKDKNKNKDSNPNMGAASVPVQELAHRDPNLAMTRPPTLPTSSFSKRSGPYLQKGSPHGSGSAPLGLSGVFCNHPESVQSAGPTPSDFSCRLESSARIGSKSPPVLVLENKCQSAVNCCDVSAEVISPPQGSQSQGPPLSPRNNLPRSQSHSPGVRSVRGSSRGSGQGVRGSASAFVQRPGGIDKSRAEEYPLVARQRAETASPHRRRAACGVGIRFERIKCNGETCISIKSVSGRVWGLDAGFSYVQRRVYERL